MKSRKTASITAIAILAVGAGVLVVWRPAAVELAYPFARAERLVRGEVWPRVAGLFRSAAVQAENLRLRQEVAALSVMRGDVVRLAEENARLRRALDYAGSRPGEWLAAEVLAGGGASSVRDAVRVGKGSLAGVRKGAVVVAPEGLVGRVTEVTPHTALVTLVTDPSVRVACEVASAGRPLSGILSGGGEERLLLRHLRGADAGASAARVFTSGRGGVFPRGIEVGTLLNVTNDVRGLEGEVLPRVDFSTLEDVFIRHEK